jgi:hypothetical protein
MTDHRGQLMDEILSGKIKVKDLAMIVLSELLGDFTMDYQPKFNFWLMVSDELVIKKAAEIETKRAEASRIAKAYRAKRTAKFREDFY